MQGDVSFTFQLKPKLLAQLRKEAKKQGLTVTGLLRVIIARECSKEAGK